MLSVCKLSRRRNYSSVVEVLIKAGANQRARTLATGKDENGDPKLGSEPIDLTTDVNCQRLLEEAEAAEQARERAVEAAVEGAKLSDILQELEGPIDGTEVDLNRFLSKGCWPEAFQHKDATDPYSESAMDFAINREDFPLLKKFLEAGASGGALLHRLCAMPRLPSYPNSSQSRDREAGRVSTLQYILGSSDIEEFVNNKAPVTGYTPLMTSAVLGTFDDVPMLLKAGANILETGVRGETALIVAAKRNHLKFIEALLPPHFDPKAPVDKKAPKVKRNRKTGLTQRQELIDHADKEGITALMWAASGGNLDVIALLLKHNDPETGKG